MDDQRVKDGKHGGMMAEEAMEAGPGRTGPSRRRLLGGAGGFVLAASGLLLPEGVAAERPVDVILNDPPERKDRNNKNRNRKDRNKKHRERTSPNALKHIRFTVANHAWPETDVTLWKRDYDGRWRRWFWYPVGPITNWVGPGKQTAGAVEETFAGVTLADRRDRAFAIFIENPAIGYPKVYVRIGLPDDPTQLNATLLGEFKEGQSRTWIPEPGRKMDIKREKDSSYKEFRIDLHER